MTLPISIRKLKERKDKKVASLPTETLRHTEREFVVWVCLYFQIESIVIDRISNAKKERSSGVGVSALRNLNVIRWATKRNLL